MAEEKEIPDSFCKDHKGPRPQVYSVCQLRYALDRLPDDLRVNCGFTEGVELVVYDRGEPTEHLEIEEIEPTF